VNEVLTKLYRASRPKEALASQDEFKSANALLGTDVEKFAELIVRECLAKAEEEAELYRGFSHLGGAAEYAKVMYNYQLLLKEHFGVEE
jgi:hypothetical protein